jgi:hypothetical protein
MWCQPSGTWYQHTYDVKTGASGLVNVRVEQAADGSGVAEYLGGIVGCEKCQL